MSQRCAVCQRRRARRGCPALGQQICAVCCGTKRLVEINCPSDCSYLTSARTHPPAVVQRQQERDLGFLLPTLRGLTSRQHQLLLLLQSFLTTRAPEHPAVVDDDVVHAARALAETYETASRGIIYEHSAALLSAERLSADIRALIEAKRGEGLRVRDEDLAVVLRLIETASREARSVLPGGESAYLLMLKRVLREPGTTAESGSSIDQPTTGGSGLIIPGR